MYPLFSSDDVQGSDCTIQSPEGSIGPIDFWGLHWQIQSWKQPIINAAEYVDCKNGCEQRYAPTCILKRVILANLSSTGPSENLKKVASAAA